VFDRIFIIKIDDFLIKTYTTKTTKNGHFEQDFIGDYSIHEVC